MGCKLGRYLENLIYLLGESLGADSGSKIGSSNGIPDRNEDGKDDRYPLVEWSFSS